MPATIIKKGLTTISWGADGVLGTPSAAIVENLTINPKGGTPIEIEDSQGFAAALVLINDGFDASVTCTYDTNLAWPAFGDAVTLTLPDKGMYDDPITGAKTAFDCILVDKQPTLAKKKEATIQLKLAYRPNVAAGVTSGGAPNP